MPRRGLLIAGIAALLIAFTGAAVQMPAAGPWGMWGGHMWSSPDGGWWQTGSSAPIEGAEELTVLARDYSFEPADLTVTTGSPVNLTLVNEGRVPHDLAVRDLGIHVTAGPGERATTGFVVDQAGTYEIVCTYPGHAAAGMAGRLRVVNS